MTTAIIFDFDGVIANSEPLHHRAFEETLAPENLVMPWKDYVGTYIGYDDRGAFRLRYKNSGRKLDDAKLAELIEKKAEAFQHLLQVTGVRPYPGVLDLIARARAKGLPVGLCTGALRSDITPILASLNIADSFACIVTAEDVSAGKPDPAGYVLAVRQLGISARTSIAIEDTPAGIEAAKGAGLKVVAVTNSYGRDKLFGADRIVATLENFRL